MIKSEAEKREPGDKNNYIKDARGKIKCKDCGFRITTIRVAHPIWIRGITGGSGRYKYEDAPFCSNCEKEPKFHGEPVYIEEILHA